MTNNDIVNEVRKFFAAVGFAGLILPSGWFGRPYDNLLELTRSEATEESLVLEFDGQLVLTFAGAPRLASTDEGLRLTGFTSLAWDWTEFGSTASHHEEFAFGEVDLVAPIG